MTNPIALVTGTTSGLGLAAARLLAAQGCRQIIVTGRSLARARETAAQLAAETKTEVFTPLELELDAPASVRSALAELVKRGRPIDFLLLNAGMVPGKKRVLTEAGVEASQAPLIGHHQLTVGLLHASLLSPNARIVIAGAEPARGGVPMFSYTAARRYLQASEFGTEVSGQFFASAQGKFSGPMEVQRQPHLSDRASQEAAWQAVVKVSGVDDSSAAPSSVVS
ncbi:MAG: SDR family NAD(P)-dependent oxidoreductase [Deltaproteobacteria bacterium]|nr:SDR family NAD(P)-dependent oxidoreductase [Deltaproteobacteria bacterium]